jgi:hypothetical protein
LLYTSLRPGMITSALSQSIGAPSKGAINVPILAQGILKTR